MTIEFTNKSVKSLEPKIKQLIYTGSKLSPKLSALMNKILIAGNITIQEVPTGTLAEAADWNNNTRTIRLENNTSSLVNFIYQLSKAGNFHFKYIKSPNDFFTAKEYAKYVEGIYFVSNLIFVDIITELKPLFELLSLPIDLLSSKLELFNQRDNRALLDSMIESKPENTFTHADIFSAQWDKFMLIEKIKKVNEILKAMPTQIDDEKSIDSSQTELQDFLDTLYDLCTRLEVMDFLSDLPVPTDLKPELLSEIDSLQPAMQLKSTLDKMNANIERLRQALPNKAGAEAEQTTASSSESNLSASRIKLQSLTLSRSSDLLPTPKRPFLVSHDLSRSRDEAPKSSSSKIIMSGFEFDNPDRLSVIESDYRSEFIDSLSTDDDLLREFQIAYFDELLASYRINCVKATEGKKDFVKDSQDEVVDLNLLTRQIIPKSKLLI